VRKLKIFFLAALAIGGVSMVGCSKSNNNSTSTKDSVYYSPWLTIVMSPTDGGDTTFTGTISASNITAATVRGGAVLTYLGEPGFPNAGDTAAESAVDFGLYSTLVPGSIQLLSFGFGNDFSTSNSGFVFRYVVVPGTVQVTDESGAVHSYTASQLKLLNYQSVAKILNLPGRSSSALLKEK
jgi:hypothetical protein